MTAIAVADDWSLVEGYFPPTVRQKFEILSYRNAAAILSQNFPRQFSQIVRALDAFEITTTMIRLPGGNKGPITKYVDKLFTAPDWQETRIIADLKFVRIQRMNVFVISVRYNDRDTAFVGSNNRFCQAYLI